MFFVNKYSVILFSCLLSLISPLITFAKTEMNTEQHLFISFENKVSDLVITSMELLSNLDKMNGELSEEELYNLTLNVGEEFATRSKILTQIKVPKELPDNIQSSLEIVKRDLSIGFTELEESMLCFAKYLAGRDQTFHDEYIQRKNTGLRYIDGGLTSLSTISLKLNVPTPRLNSLKEIWKKHLE
ncbi:hypothetical protein [Bacillus sp. FSL K6-0067]|uniref:hypothetical protein n=1 Tax=Bacillus sp. FSL K6-0067 TaxID=2921412 RepID=UPI00077AED31|nr:hypothetical protein [Bacillus cereus]KXY25967.1 hypothetical protein AT267_09605 [Bacillus cereus]